MPTNSEVRHAAAYLSPTRSESPLSLVLLPNAIRSSSAFVGCKPVLEEPYSASDPTRLVIAAFPRISQLLALPKPCCFFVYLFILLWISIYPRHVAFFPTRDAKRGPISRAAA